MSIELIRPLGARHLDAGDAVELIVRAGEGVAAAGIELLWSIQGAQSKFGRQLTRIDRSGRARNSLSISGAEEPGSRRIIIRTPDGDPLLDGKPLILYLPQWAAAGYFDSAQQAGRLQADYSVHSRGALTPRWSAVSPAYTLNTTF